MIEAIEDVVAIFASVFGIINTSLDIHTKATKKLQQSKSVSVINANASKQVEGKVESRFLLITIITLVTKNDEEIKTN